MARDCLRKAKRTLTCLLLGLPTAAFGGAVCHDLWLSPSCGAGTCSHHGGVWAWCECPGMEMKDNYIDECPTGVVVETVPVPLPISPAAAAGLTVASGVAGLCSTGDEVLCKAAVAIGGSALALGALVRAANIEDCEWALQHANRRMHREFEGLKRDIEKLKLDKPEEGPFGTPK